LKQINDRYGHANGDRVLQQVAKVLHGELRGEDLLGRYGGEEFAIAAPGLDIRESRNLAERLRSAIETKTGLGIRKMPWLVVTASLGFASDRGVALSISALLEQADKAMYEAKRTGRNRSVYYEPDTGNTILVSEMEVD
jgi:two-component system, cell cycle response regulator